MATVGLKGGEALVRRLEEMAKKLGDGGTLRVGFLEGATYPDGTPVALVAAVNEFGRPDRNQPPRPFFRGMISEKQKDWPRALGAVAKNTDYDIDKTLGQMGEGIKGQLQESIQQLDSPALSPVTVARKGFDKPLIDSGHLMASVDYETDT